MGPLTFHVSPVLSLYFSAPYTLSLAHILLLPAAFMNYPRMFFISMQSLFGAFCYIEIVDFGLRAVMGLFPVCVLGFPNGVTSASHHSD